MASRVKDVSGHLAPCPAATTPSCSVGDAMKSRSHSKMATRCCRSAAGADSVAPARSDDRHLTVHGHTRPERYDDQSGMAMRSNSLPPRSRAQRTAAAQIKNLSPPQMPGARLPDQLEGGPNGTGSEANWREIKEVADREGFEPPIPLRVCRISSAVHSTTLPPVRGRFGRSGLVTTHCVRPAQAFPTRCVHNSVIALKSFAAMLLFLDGSPLRD